MLAINRVKCLQSATDSGKVYNRIANSQCHCLYSITCSVTSESFGALLTSGEGASSLLLFHPVFFRESYVKYDREFRRACCGLAGMCGQFYMRRPPNDCSSYMPPTFSKTWRVHSLSMLVWHYTSSGIYFLLVKSYLCKLKLQIFSALMRPRTNCVSIRSSFNIHMHIYSSMRLRHVTYQWFPMPHKHQCVANRDIRTASNTSTQPWQL